MIAGVIFTMFAYMSKTMQGGYTPHICPFWNTATLFRPVKSTPKSKYIHDKIAKFAQNRPKFGVRYTKSTPA